VLDNLHALAPDSPLGVILEAGLPEVAQPCCIVVTSRAPPPVALARLQAQRTHGLPGRRLR
jgi:hypothetical protein